MKPLDINGMYYICRTWSAHQWGTQWRKWCRRGESHFCNLEPACIVYTCETRPSFGTGGTCILYICGTQSAHPWETLWRKCGSRGESHLITLGHNCLTLFIFQVSTSCTWTALVGTCFSHVMILCEGALVSFEQQGPTQVIAETHVRTAETHFTT